MTLRSILIALTVALGFVSTTRAQAPLFVSWPALSSEARLEYLLGRWQLGRQRARSLVVDFALQRRNPNFPNASAEEFDGRFEWRRFADGRVAGSLTMKSRAHINDFWKFVLVNERLYMYVLEPKQITVLPLPKGETFDFLKEWFQPFVVLIDRRQAQLSLRITVRKQSDWYTYVEVHPRTRQFGSRFAQGEIAVLNRNTKHIPIDMPRRICFLEPNRMEVTYDIRKWEIDSRRIKRKEFRAPKPAFGWKIVDSTTGEVLEALYRSPASFWKPAPTPDWIISVPPWVAERMESPYKPRPKEDKQ